MSSAPDLTGTLLRRERLIVGAGIGLLAALSWWFLASGAGMDGPAVAAMGMPGIRQPPFCALVLMWWLMMLAMMLPSASPAILLYSRVRGQRGGEGAVVHPAVFAGGYGVVWLGFSVVAAAFQLFIATPAMTLADPQLASAFLIAAGLYQLSPFKSTCLSQCQSPARFLSTHWRRGALGAARLGVLHGAWCVGCCWMLMALLFVGGVMNLAWIVVVALIVGSEKLLPGGRLIGRIAGIGLIAWGTVRLLL